MDDHAIIEAESVAIETRAREREMDPIASAAIGMLRENPTPETADKILDFLERLDANHARKAYAAAMIGLKRDLPSVIAKNAKGHTNRYARLDGIMSVVQPILSKHGFDISWKSTPAEKGLIVVTCRLTHEAGHYEECSTPPAPPDTGPGRNQLQAICSTMTYLSRYSLVLLLGLATGDAPDPDEPRAEDPGSVDPKRNNAMVTAVRRRNRPLVDAEELVGRPSAQWTAADREEVSLWLRATKDDDEGSAT
jgi:hypothetical protein